MPALRVVLLLGPLFLLLALTSGGCASAGDRLRERAEAGEVQAMLEYAAYLSDSMRSGIYEEVQREERAWRYRAVETDPEAVPFELLLEYTNARMGQISRALQAARGAAEADYQARLLAAAMRAPAAPSLNGNYFAFAALLARGLAAQDPLCWNGLTFWDPKMIASESQEVAAKRAETDADAALWFRRAYPREAWPKPPHGERDALLHELLVARWGELLERRPALREPGDPEPR